MAGNDNTQGNNNQGGDDPANKGNQGATGAQGGTADQKKTDTGNQSSFDISKLSDDDFAKVFDDERLFAHPRFKKLNEKAKTADELTKAQEEAERKRLEDEGKWKELAEQEKAKATKAEQRAQQIAIDNKVQVLALQAGVTDADAALKLIDRSQITVDENGNVTGADGAVKSLVEAKPYLLSNNDNKRTVGTPTNPANNSNQNVQTRFKLSQIRDPQFYREHEKEIDAAMKVPGAIIRD